MRLLVGDPGRTATNLGPGFEYLLGSVTDSWAVDRAVQGADGVLIALTFASTRPRPALAAGPVAGDSYPRMEASPTH